MSYKESHINRSHDYDKGILADDFGRYMLEREASILNKIIPRLGRYSGVQGPGETYLDFACGTGRVTQIFEQHFPVSFGVDVSENMISVAKEKCSKTTFVLADILNDDVELPKFDVISSFRFFGNAEDELRIPVLDKLHALLDDQGTLIINNHRNPSSLMNLFSKATGGTTDEDLTHKKLNSLLDSAGFKVVRRISIGSWMFRHKLISVDVYNSKLGRFLDRVFNRAFLAPISPDVIIIARKKNI